MELLADHWNIEVAEVRTESHSSKTSGTRPVFNRLIKDIQLGYFNGIVTWAPDRLSRNAGDLGILVDLMDEGKLVQSGKHDELMRSEGLYRTLYDTQFRFEQDLKGSEPEVFEGAE